MPRIALLLIAIALFPGTADACAVCGPGTEESRVAFIITTAFMTALPLALIGGAVYALRRRLAEMERRSQADREAALRAAGIRATSL
jgi:hypothetical protein